MAAKPTSSNAWDVAPKLEAGTEVRDDLYMAVGRATSAWESLDFNQAALFGILCGGTNQGAQAAYGTVLSGGGRCDMVLAAAERVVADADLLAEIKNIMGHIRKLASRRNEIAHGCVGGFFSKDGEEHVPHGYFLTPAGYDSRAWAKPDTYDADDPFWFSRRYAYTAEQVNAYADAFTDYSFRIAALWDRARVSTGQESLQERLEQAAPPPPGSR